MKTPDQNTPNPDQPQPGRLDMMSCTQALRQIERMIEDGDLKDVERRLLFTHIRGCSSCKQELQRSRNLELRLKDTFAALDTRSDFADRLLSALPDEDPRPEARSVPLPPRVSRATTRKYPPASYSVRRFLWRWRVPLAVSALVCVGLLGARLRYGALFGGLNESDKPPVVCAHGIATLNRQPMAAEQDHIWNTNETIKAAPDAELTLSISFNETPLATIVLQPGAEIAADNHHSFKLVQGSAFFDVQKNSLHNEFFEVAAGKFGTVKVTGTHFGVAVETQGATVAVSEGRVEVSTSAGAGKSVVVTHGQQVALSSSRQPLTVTAMDLNGALLARDAVLSAKLQTPVSPSIPGITIPALTPQNLQPQPRVETEFNWDKPLPLLPLNLAGKTLSQGLELLADRFNRPQPLLDLVQQASGPLIAKDAVLSFSVHSAMSLREVLLWMARDVGTRFEIAADGRSGRFTLAHADELPGEPSFDTALPRYVLQKLDTKPDRLSKATGKALPAILEEMSFTCGVTIIADRSAWQTPDVAAPQSASPLTASRRLDSLMLAGGLGAIWYDSVVYVAPAARIEALTDAEYKTRVDALVGNPVNKVWAHELTRVLEEFKAMPKKLPYLLAGVPNDQSGWSIVADSLVGSTAYCDVAIDAENSVLTCRAGRLGRARMETVLASLQSPALPPPSPAQVLTEPIATKNFADLNALLEMGKPMVVCRSRNRLFNNQAYVVKNLSAGKAIEWGTWLQGLGIRNVNGTYIIDDAAACYGSPSLQVLSLAPVIELRRELAPELPRAFAALLPQIYPAFFSNVAVRELSGRVCFFGDERQLSLACELLSALQLELAAAKDERFDVSTWRPQWRRDLDKELAEPFHGDTESVKRAFAGALRQSGLGLQLRHTIMVDPASMKEHANDPVGEIDVTGMTVQQVIKTLAGSVHLKMEIDGDVIWLKP
jgi:hypothetical protein